ncbi:MAG TPA: Trk system potassium transporter TrkA [Trueperaceae bacterium]|nr:Trk system potassium transporter TrkA [Trueperaceae bacterium]
MQIVIVGGGEIGALIAAALHRTHSVTIIDQDPEREAAFTAMDVQFVRGNGTDPEDLRAANADRARAFIACTSSDDVNVLACLAAKGLGAKETLAFVTRQRYVDAFKRDGAFESVGLLINRVLWPQRILAHQIADIVRVPRAIDSARFANGRIMLLEFLLEPHDPFLNSRLDGITLPPGVLAVGAIQGDSFHIPTGATVLEAGDRVVFMGTSEKMRDMQRRFAPQRHSQKVVIVGGGNVGFMVAQQLTSGRADLTIIEQDQERCEKLAQLLPRALVLKGDGTDLELLEQERVEDADVIVAVTDDDAKNLLVSLLGKQLGIPKVVTRVGRTRNRRLFMRVGIDSPLTPRAAAVQEVLNWLGVDEVEHLATIEDRAEVMEATYPPESAGGRVMDLGTPGDMLIGAVLRNERIIVPNGETVIQPGDHLYLVTTPDCVGEVEEWLDERRSRKPVG